MPLGAQPYPAQEISQLVLGLSSLASFEAAAAPNPQLLEKDRSHENSKRLAFPSHHLLVIAYLSS
jgi:hypothetical protein